MPPDKQTYDDLALTRYLLGTLSEEDREHFDELSVTDDEFAWRLRAVENDLVDAYVKGELAAENLDRFRSTYLSSAHGREKVDFAEAFQRQAGARAPAPPKAVAGSDGRRIFNIAHLAHHWGLAAAVLLLMAGAWLLWDNLRLRSQLTRERTQSAAIERRVRELESRRDQQSPPAAEPTTVSLALLAQVRSAGSIPSIALKSGTELVLQLELESDDFAEYQAFLKDPAADRIVWRSGPLKPVALGERKTVSATLPANLLHTQNYSVELNGIPAAAGPELVSTYAFRAVVR